MPKAKNPSKSKKIQSVIAGLFARNGYHSTSMREIARELGMNASSLYHYMKSKEEILFRLMNDAIDDALVTMEEICAADLTPEDKLDRVLEFYIRYYAGDQDRLILLVNEMNALNNDYRKILVDKQRRYVNLIRSILKELAQDREMKPIDPTIATFAFFGMVHYTIKWYHKDGPIGLNELAHGFLEIFTQGIRSRPHYPDQTNGIAAV